MRPIFPLLCAAALSSTNVQACINDRDSDALAVQAQKLPDALRVITGRFERNPPRFYQMRVARVKAELKKNPRNFALYDDLGASLDRLGKSDEALQTMNRKRELLPIYNAKDAANKEAWYRFYANAGTFRAHRWLHDGANVKTINEMKAARDWIKRAIEIKPNAHFGREKYQLMTMDWIVSTKTKKTDKSLGKWIEVRDNWRIYEEGEGAMESYENGVLVESNPGRKGDSESQIAAKKERRREATEGLSGLVVLGAAWESVDVFEALSRALAVDEGVTVQHLALLRCEELMERGRKSLGSSTIDTEELMDHGSSENHYVAVSEVNRKTLRQFFPKLRAEAESWSTKRTAYMNARFDSKQHPDTHPNFWNNWKPANAPSLDVPWNNDARKRREQTAVWIYVFFGVVALVLATIIGLIFWAMVRFSKRHVA